MNAPIRAAILTVLPALFLGGVSYAAPPVSPVPSVQAAPVGKLTTEVQLKDGATTPGEKKTYDVLLVEKANGKALGGKKIGLVIEGKNGTIVPSKVALLGEALTDDQGHAKIATVTPDLAQGAYALKAIFIGDQQYARGSADANLFIAKAVTKFDLGDMYWGTYKDEAGAPYGTINITLTRTSDGKGVKKPIKMWINGKQNVVPTDSYWQMVLMPLEAKSWTVKVEFEGDDASLAASAERTYHRPAK